MREFINWFINLRWLECVGIGALLTFSIRWCIRPPIDKIMSALRRRSVAKMRKELEDREHEDSILSMREAKEILEKDMVSFKALALESRIDVLKERKTLCEEIAREAANKILEEERDGYEDPNLSNLSRLDAYKILLKNWTRDNTEQETSCSESGANNNGLVSPPVETTKGKKKSPKITKAKPYMTVIQVAECDDYPFTVGQLRGLLHNRKENGLSSAVTKAGRNLIIRKDLFEAWLDSNQNKLKKTKKTPPTTRTEEMKVQAYLNKRLLETPSEAQVVPYKKKEKS